MESIACSGTDRVFVTHEGATVRGALGDLRYARVTPGLPAMMEAWEASIAAAL